MRKGTEGVSTSEAELIPSSPWESQELPLGLALRTNDGDDAHKCTGSTGIANRAGVAEAGGERAREGLPGLPPADEAARGTICDN